MNKLTFFLLGLFYGLLQGFNKIYFWNSFHFWIWFFILLIILLQEQISELKSEAEK